MAEDLSNRRLQLLLAVLHLSHWELRLCCKFRHPHRPGTISGMAKRQRVASVRLDQSFKGRQFTAEVILWAVRLEVYGAALRNPAQRDAVLGAADRLMAAQFSGWAPALTRR